MVPPLSALSLALCHEALEGGGNQQIRKKKLPLLLVRNSLPHKATAFVPQCSTGAILPFFGFQKLYTIYGAKPNRDHKF